jgi:hypothetical protein
MTKGIKIQSPYLKIKKTSYNRPKWKKKKLSLRAAKKEIVKDKIITKNVKASIGKFYRQHNT